MISRQSSVISVSRQSSVVPIPPKAAIPAKRPFPQAAAKERSFDVHKVADGIYAVIRREPAGFWFNANNVFIIGKSEVIVVAGKRRLKIVTIPIDLGFVDGIATSHYKPLKDTLRIAWAVVRARLLW